MEEKGGTTERGMFHKGQAKRWALTNGKDKEHLLQGKGSRERRKRGRSIIGGSILIISLWVAVLFASPLYRVPQKLL